MMSSWPTVIFPLLLSILFCQLSGRCLAALSQCAVGNNLRAEISVVEEQNENSVVENLNEVTRQALERSGLPGHSLLPLRFTLLESNLFRVSFNEATNESLLLIKNRLDRESLCYTEGTCCSNMDNQISAKRSEILTPSSKSDCSLSLILMVDLQNNLDFSVEECLLSLTLRVLDINDNAPSWPVQGRREKPEIPLRYGGSSARESGQMGNQVMSVLDLPIKEHTKIGTKFELPLAVDPDAYPENTTAHYEIDHNSPNSDLFTLEWTGKSQHLDFSAESQSSEGDPRNGPSPMKLWLVLNKEIDRDVQSSYQIKIAAVDGAVSKPQTGYLLLNITVEDINDHPPEFEKRVDFVWVVEHSPIGSIVYKVKATDRDESDLDKLTYSLAATATPAVCELFAVDQRTGDVRVQGDLDYEQQTSFQVPITVTDGLWSDEAKITIGLININDHPPSISLHSHLSATKFQSYEMLQRVPNSQLTIEVRENGPPDQLIATFSVTDLDDAAEERFLQTDSTVREAFLRTNGINLQQVMERIGQPPTCKINSDLLTIQQLAVNANSRSFKSRFQIRLANKALDREVSAKYLIRLECWDQTNRFGNTILAQSQSRMGGLHHPFARSTSVLFSLIVLDENDSVPQFVGPTTGTIAEGLPAGTLIMQLTAKDADDPYTLGGQAGLRFHLSRDPIVRYAQSYGQNHSSANKETRAMLHPPSTWFSLDPRTGDLRSSVVFDRETVQSINLTITVNDGGDEDGSNASRTLHHNTATTTVQINIQDVNDCAPVFDSPIYELNVSEGAAPPLLIGRVHVSDCDSDEGNRLLHYWLQQPRTIPPEFIRSEGAASKRQIPTVPLLAPTITSPSSSARWFTISRSGELYLGSVTQRRLGSSQASQATSNHHLQDWRPLDREREEVIVLDVCARDHGQPALTGSAQIIIRLLDINDNSPVWQFPRSNERILNVSLEASVGQKVAQRSLEACRQIDEEIGRGVYLA
ncbi:homophilic cell adhesion via plasma membrane adhesion molecules [Sparganum proliferum]